MHILMTQTFNFLNSFLYPKVYPIHDINEKKIQEQFYAGQYLEDSKVVMPTNIASTVEKIKPEGIYLIDTGSFIYVWVSRVASESAL